MRTCFLAGELRHVLKYAGLYENTALVFHGTHGEALGEHGLFFQHGENLFREDLSVPLILWVPGTRPGRTNEIVSTLDLMPTLLALFDVPPPVALRGEDLLSVEGPTRGWAFSESYPPSAAARTCALTGPRWKVLQSVAGDVRVFDLERDPMERTGLATPYPAEARAWLDRFEALRVEPREAGPERTLSDAELRLWRGLGYDL